MNTKFGKTSFERLKGNKQTNKKIYFPTKNWILIKV